MFKLAIRATKYINNRVELNVNYEPSFAALLFSNRVVDIPEIFIAYIRLERDFPTAYHKTILLKSYSY